MLTRHRDNVRPSVVWYIFKLLADFLAHAVPLVLLELVLMLVDVAPDWTGREGIDQDCGEVVEVGFGGWPDVDVAVAEICLVVLCLLLLLRRKRPCLVT